MASSFSASRRLSRAFSFSSSLVRLDASAFFSDPYWFSQRYQVASVGAMIRTCGWFSARRREWAHLPGNDLKFHQL